MNKAEPIWDLEEALFNSSDEPNTEAHDDELTKLAQKCAVTEELCQAIADQFPDWHLQLGRAHKASHLDLAAASGEYRVMKFIEKLCQLGRD